MIQLRQADCPPALAPSLGLLRPLFGPLSACAWFTGKGPWNQMRQNLSVTAKQFAFFFQDGSHRLPQPGDLKDNPNFIELMMAVDEIATLADADTTNAAIILRPIAYVAMLSTGNCYVPMPDSTAHERLEDPAALEREFPGIFHF